jgi:hypothetical protein
LGTRRPSLGPPGGGCPPQCEGWADHPSGWVQAIGRYCLHRNLGSTVVSIRKPGGQDPRGGPLAPPRGVQRLALPRTWSRQAVKAAPASAGQLLPPLTAGIARRSAPRWLGRAAWLAEPGGCTSRTLPELSCLALAPLIAATGVALGAFRRRGFIDDDSDAIRLRNPTRSRRLAGSRACVGDHLLPVTGGTYDSRCRRLGSPQSSPEVPAETQEGPAGTGRGWGHSGRIGVRGPAAGGAGQERGRPPPRPVDISDQVRSVTAGAGLAFRGRLAGAPRPLPGGRYCRTWERPGGATPSRRTRRTG